MSSMDTTMVAPEVDVEEQTVVAATETEHKLELV